MEHRPRKRRRTSSINDSDLPRRKCVRSVLNELQRTAEEVRCALNDATWLSVEERVRAALIIDHVAMMSTMMERGYEFGDGDEEMEEDEEEEYEDGDRDENEDEDNAGEVVEEVAYGDLDNAFVEDVSGVLDEENEDEGSCREEDRDEDGLSDAVEEDDDSYSSWITRGVSFSAGAMCTACTENGCS